MKDNLKPALFVSMAVAEGTEAGKLAAIEAGVSPETAQKVTDHIIQGVETKLNDQALKDFVKSS